MADSVVSQRALRGARESRLLRHLLKVTIAERSLIVCRVYLLRSPSRFAKNGEAALEDTTMTWVGNKRVIHSTVGWEYRHSFFDDVGAGEGKSYPCLLNPNLLHCGNLPTETPPVVEKGTVV